MPVNEITDELFRLQDEKYREFQIKLLPTVDPETVIGIRTPELRAYAKKLVKNDGITEFLDALPHRYFDENQLHAFIVSAIKDYGQCIEEVKRFLPFVDNWATCDQMSPKIFAKHKSELLDCIKEWLTSPLTYTQRFAVGMLMEHYLDDDFDAAYLDMVARIKSDEYYVNMMIAWYFATALAKQYEATVPYLEEQRLDTWTHNKTIQKALESYRITPDHKTYLKSLKLTKK
ncbi:MAG: DNA alkylation repair protein [Coriobacteriales bacterium]|nr:DNA alkylation repair protein [Coriobacteriales bacterium]